MLSWLGRKQTRSTQERWPLDLVLGQLSRRDAWRLSDAVTGALLLGSTGSGKSSGVARFFIQRLLRQGFGGLALCVKPEDRSDIERYARAYSREQDLVIFGPGQSPCCNLLNYELSHGGGSKVSRLENAIALFQTALEIVEQDRHTNSSGDNKYFERAALQAMRAALLVLIVADEPISVSNIHRFIMAAPTSLEESRDAGWRERSYCYQTLCKADDQPLSVSEEQDFELSVIYWMREYAGMDIKPRSSILSTLTTMLDIFQRGFVRDSFFGETTITPEACRDGKIIVLDYPTLRWNKVGQIVQSLFKFVWQRSQERCEATRKQTPVFLFSDEAHQFFTRWDGPFQATARSSRVATIYVTQNLPGMYEACGGEAGKHSIHALMSNLRLKVLCAQDCTETCTWQSELIGKTKKLFFNSNSQSSPQQEFDFFRPGQQHSAGASESLEYTIAPWEWSRDFRTGGAEHGYLVDAIAYQGGRVWSNGKTYLPVTFSQKGEV